MIAEEYGKVYSDECKVILSGTIETESARIAIERMELPLTIEEFLKKFHENSDLQLPTCPLLPGLRFHIDNIYIYTYRCLELFTPYMTKLNSVARQNLSKKNI